MAAAAGRIVAIERMYKKLEESGATSPETAVKPEELGITEWMLSDLIRFKKVIETGDGRIFIDCKDDEKC
jgi:hypothetical protein